MLSSWSRGQGLKGVCVYTKSQGDVCKYNDRCVHAYPPDSAVFIYKDLLKAPTPAEDIAATYRRERWTDENIFFKGK